MGSSAWRARPREGRRYGSKCRAPTREPCRGPGAPGRMSTVVQRVLICDDHAVVRAGLRLILETQPGFALVAEAANGAEAVAQATALHPDIVILDLSLPGLSGLAAIPALQQAVPDVKVLVLT